MYKRLKGLTLVELLLVIAIVAILVVVMTGAFNPSLMITKANDSRRKKDVGRIKVSFEDYYNDKGCYPTEDMINQLSEEDNCNSGIFAPWLRSWPCDPVSKQPYYVYSEDSDCPSWFKVITNLGNKNDVDIPENWYDHDDFYTFGYGTLTVNDANHGTSSTNVLWYDYTLSSDCVPSWRCCYRSGENQCDGVANCSGSGCYIGLCLDRCHVPSCGND